MNFNIIIIIVIIIISLLSPYYSNFLLKTSRLPLSTYYTNIVLQAMNPKDRGNFMIPNNIFISHADDRAAVWFYSNKMWVRNFACVM